MQIRWGAKWTSVRRVRAGFTRIESGEDPDKVMEDMDPAALGGMGDDGEDGMDNFGGDDDF